MAITSVGNSDGALLAAEVLQKLTSDLGQELVAVPANSAKGNGLMSTASSGSQLATNSPAPIFPATISPTTISPTTGVPAISLRFAPPPAAGVPGPIPIPEDSVVLHDMPDEASPPFSLRPATRTNPSTAPLNVTTIPRISLSITPTSTQVPVALPPDKLLPERSSGNGPIGHAPISVRGPGISSPAVMPPATLPILLKEDIATVLMAQVASSDLGKLTRILDPAPDPENDRILEALLGRAVKEVAGGNAERAVGYLADYATRDPRRAEALPLTPELAPVRDKIDAMVSRMTVVAKMTAEDGLSRAEQTSSQNAGKLSNWDTHSDVLLKLAHRLFEAGGYANYSRTSDLARLVSETAPESKPARALAASAAAATAPLPQSSQMMPGVNVPYWATPDVPSVYPMSGRVQAPSTPRKYLSTPIDDVIQNLRDLKDISTHALTQLWVRAPLLAMLLTWLAAGLLGGIAFAIGSHIWPDSILVNVGSFAFNLWALGFLALVGFGFYVRIRYPPRR